MRRRGFLGLLGLAPAMPLLSKEVLDGMAPALPPVLAPVPTQPAIWKLQPLDAKEKPWRGMEPVDAECRELAVGELPFIRPPSEHARQIELTATFPAGKAGEPMPYYSRVHFMGKPVLTMPTQAWGTTAGETITIVQSVQIN